MESILKKKFLPKVHSLKYLEIMNEHTERTIKILKSRSDLYRFQGHEPQYLSYLVNGVISNTDIHIDSLFVNYDIVNKEINL